MQEPIEDQSERRHRWLLFGLLIFALAVRVAWSLGQPVNDQDIDRLPDQREYLSLAQNMLSGKGLQFFDPRFNDVVYAFRAPGYAAWIAACGANVRIVRLSQALLDTSTVLATCLLARALLRYGSSSRAGGLIAGAFVAINPSLIFFTGLLLSETLFTALLAWGMLCLVIGPKVGTIMGGPSARRRGLILWMAGGLLLALSALVRPSALALPVLLGIASVFVVRSERSGVHQNWLSGPAYHQPNPDSAPWPPKGWPIPVGATMLLLTMLVITPWAYRNWRVAGEWVWTTTNEGVTAYDGFNPNATGASDQSFLRDLPQLKLMGEVERSRYLSARATEFVRDNPTRAVQLGLIKAARTWSPVPLSHEYGDWKRSVVLFAYTVPLDILILAGLFGPFAGGLRRAAKVFVLLPAIYFTLVHMMSIGSLRYRIPFEPPMAVAAAAALTEVGRYWRSRERTSGP